ncbi:MAG: hypothetical protein JXA71_14530 [Chitinispirillaceae bacterium]|nr:hypothetical protein [Chitinispirillaceae bacterium]
MFLVPTAELKDDNGVITLFAEDFNFAPLWNKEISPDDAIREETDEEFTIDNVLLGAVYS